MAWCPHCSEDRPIKRLLAGAGTDAVGVDTCQFCHTRVFAKAQDRAAYLKAVTAADKAEALAMAAQAEAERLTPVYLGVLVLFLVIGVASVCLFV